MAHQIPQNPWKDLWNVSLLPTVVAVGPSAPPPGNGPGPATARALQRPALLSVSESTSCRREAALELEQAA